MRNGSLSVIRRLGLISVFATLAACGSNEPAQVGSLGPAQLPNYGLGDSYAFSDGSTETVVAVDGDAVHWRSSDGTYTTSRDVLLPRLSWSNGSTQGERYIGAGPVLLFPLQLGKRVKFTATSDVRDRQGQVTVQEAWNCGVVGTARVATQAGDFDTWRVDCTMVEQPPVTGDGLIQRSFYYAPDIGFFARIEENVGDGSPRVAELTSYTTADPALAVSALRARSSALQRAMESETSGNRLAWADPATGSSGEVTVVDTRRSERYGWCRDFAERIRWAGRTYLLQGTGCRDPRKVWDIVALEPGRVGAN